MKRGISLIHVEKLSNMRCVSEEDWWTRERNTTWWPTSDLKFAAKWLCLAMFWSSLSQGNTQNISVKSAVLTYSYTNSETQKMAEGECVGSYGAGSLVLNASGFVVHVRVSDGSNHGCNGYVNSPEGAALGEPWVALVQRGMCKFQQKINMASLHNATAIVIYNNTAQKNGDAVEIHVMDHEPINLTTVLITHGAGQKLVDLVDSGIAVHMNIVEVNLDLGNRTNGGGRGPNKHTTIVLLAFVGFLIVGLIIVVVYAVRHARYVHSRNQANLAITMQSANLAQQNLLNSESRRDPQPVHTNLSQLHNRPPPPLTVQSRHLPTIQELPNSHAEEEEGEEPGQDQVEQNHIQQSETAYQEQQHSLDLSQNSPLLPH